MYDFDAQKIKEEMRNEMDNFLMSLEKPSILVAGREGCGKSSLCNLVFNKEICKVGVGEPITKGIIKASERDCPVIIYDSEGYESGASFSENNEGEGDQNYYSLIFDFIEKQDINRSPIDVIWYCISAPKARVTDVDIKIINSLVSRKKPVAVILTKIDIATEDDCDELKRTIKEKIPSIKIVYESSTDPSISVSNGLNEIHQWTIDHLNESRKAAFIHASNRNLELKREKCLEYVNYGAAAAAAAAISPIPMSDSAIISAIQLTMLSKIAAAWDLADIGNLVKESIVTIIAQNVGKTLAGNIIKFIPGLGSLIGAAINATVAAAVTYGIGYAFNEACYSIKKAALDNDLKDINSYFGEEFKRNIKKYTEDYKKNNS